MDNEPLNKMELCPTCKIPIERNYGLPGVVGKCKSCGKEFIEMLGKLVSRQEYFQRADAEHN